VQVACLCPTITLSHQLSLSLSQTHSFFHCHCHTLSLSVPQAVEYETTLANITELEEALALAQEQVGC
jgi:hypothetical protein